MFGTEEEWLRKGAGRWEEKSEDRWRRKGWSGVMRKRRMWEWLGGDGRGIGDVGKRVGRWGSRDGEAEVKEGIRG